MTAEQFAYWLQGYAELTAGQLPTPEQWKSINDHLQTVFLKVTPPLEIKVTPSLRSSELRLEDMIRDANKHLSLPGGAPLITC